MNIRYQNSCQNIQWDRIPILLKKVGMSFTDTESHRISFENSFSIIFAFDNDELIAFGRLISDGVRQSALYDIAVDPRYQGHGVGRNIVKKLISTTPNCNFILYASPGKEAFYQKLSFKKMKTGMALFSNPERMIDGIFVEND